MSYEPKGKVAAFLRVVEADLSREFTSREVAQIVGCDPRAVTAMLDYTVKASLIFRRWVGKSAIWRGQPYNPDEVRREREAKEPRQARNPMKMAGQKGKGWQPEPGDPRIPRVVQGWTPPKMVPPRASA